MMGVSSARSLSRLTVSLHVSALASSQKDDAAARPKRKATRKRKRLGRYARMEPPRCMSKRIFRSNREKTLIITVVSARER